MIDLIFLPTSMLILARILRNTRRVFSSTFEYISGHKNKLHNKICKSIFWLLGVGKGVCVLLAVRWTYQAKWIFYEVTVAEILLKSKSFV